MSDAHHQHPVDPKPTPVTDPAEIVLDERGRTCPHPVIALGRASKALPPGSRIDLIADDPAAASDVPAWCRMTRAELLGSEIVDAETAGEALAAGTPEAAGAAVARRYRVKTPD